MLEDKQISENNTLHFNSLELEVQLGVDLWNLNLNLKSNKLP